MLSSVMTVRCLEDWQYQAQKKMRSSVREVGPQDEQAMMLIKGCAKRKPGDEAMESLMEEDAKIRDENGIVAPKGKGRGRGRGKGKGKGKGKSKSKGKVRRAQVKKDRLDKNF